MDKSRFEIIIDNIINDGGYRKIQSAWKLSRSEGAKIESEMISLSIETQDKITKHITSISAKDIREYSTENTKAKIRKVLRTFASGYLGLAKQLAVANVISGKLKENANSKLSGNELINKVSLDDGDFNLINKMVSESASKINNCVLLTESSINSMLQKAAVSYSNLEEAKRDDIQNPTQNTTLVTEPIELHVQNEKRLTKKELDEIRKNPSHYARMMSMRNTQTVANLRNDYNQKKLSDNDLRQRDAKSVKQQIKRSLLSDGLLSFLDSGGRKWSFVAYCSLIARSLASQTTNIGEVFADKEHDLYYLKPHGGSCPICMKYEGKVYSRSGTSTVYPPLSSVFKKIDPNGDDSIANRYMSIHPNCRHKLVKFIEKTGKTK